MARAQKIVDRMLRPYIEQYERQQEEMERNHHKYYTTLPEIMVSSCNVTYQCRKLQLTIIIVSPSQKEHAKTKEQWKKDAALKKQRKSSTASVIRKKRKPEENAKIISALIQEERKCVAELLQIAFRINLHCLDCFQKIKTL